MTRRSLILFVLTSCAMSWRATAQSPAATLTVAAASDLQTVLPELITRFERDTHVKVTVSFGSSGSFFAQIQNGAPFDLFFSADIDYPRKLVSAGAAEADSLHQYASGRLVLWTRRDSGVNLDGGLPALTDARVRRVAIANPQLAPYGRAALAALQQSGLDVQLKPKIVYGENIAQTAQLAESGNADVGILALSLARGEALSKSGRYVEIPASAHPPIDQAVVVTSASTRKETARALLVYLKRPETVRFFAEHGFAPGR